MKEKDRMFRKKNYGSVSFMRVFWIVLGLAALIQLAVISYNAYTGFIHINNTWEFLVRFFYGTSLSTPMGLLIIYPDIIVIQFLNRRFGWSSRIAYRIVLQFFSSILISVTIASLLTTLANLLTPYTHDLLHTIVINSLIVLVINIILMVGLEALFFFRESRLSKLKAEKLEQELSQIRFEVLKNQINPHFLFNSLNVLSSLISKDTQKAQQFIDEFAMIYRYVLETIEKPVVSLSKELEFVRSYLFLQRIRYGESLESEINLNSDLMEYYLPPLSLQVVLENAIKHNLISREQPLKISIYAEGDILVIKNSLQRKRSIGKSTGIGQQNLVKRFALVSGQTPLFLIENEYYIVKLPLIKGEE